MYFVFSSISGFLRLRFVAFAIFVFMYNPGGIVVKSIMGARVRGLYEK